ncbi:MAG: hypothetical protein ABWY58_16735 [Aeromicrobium sp.]
MATVLTGAVMALAAGCGSDASDGPSTEPSAPTAAASESPTAGTQDGSAAALVGDWEIPAEQYTLHLVDDGTFVEDFQGVVDFRTGKYEVDGDTVSLVGADGNTDKGKIVGDTLEFTLGTANRVE